MTIRTEDPRFLELMSDIAQEDHEQLVAKNRRYGDSWIKRGGVDTYMMLARKWDRIEHIVEGNGFNVVTLAVGEDDGDESLLDQIGDLRRYLLLVEAEVRLRRG